MDEVTFTDEGAKQVARLLSAPPEGAYLYADVSGIGAAGVGLGWATEPGGDGRYIYSSGPAQGDNLSSDRPLTDAELDAVLEAGGFKPAELAGYWEPVDARDIKVGDKLRLSRGHLVAGYYGLGVWRAGTAPDRRTYEEGYADGLADGSQPSIKLGFDAGLEEGFDKGINLASRVARIAPGMHPAFAIKAAKKARLAYWESLGQPRSSEPKEASLLAWVAAVSAAVAV